MAPDTKLGGRPENAPRNDYGDWSTAESGVGLLLLDLERHPASEPVPTVPLTPEGWARVKEVADRALGSLLSLGYAAAEPLKRCMIQVELTLEAIAHGHPNAAVAQLQQAELDYAG